MSKASIVDLTAGFFRSSPNDGPALASRDNTTVSTVSHTNV
jgi:hypothetical protein